MDLLVAEPLEPEVLHWLEQHHTVLYAPRLAEDRCRLTELLAQARAAMLPAQVAIDRRLLAGAPRLLAIGRVVGGAEHLDLAACQRAGVEVVRCAEAATPAEAEFLLGALMSMLRPDPREPRLAGGRELGHCTVGLVGMGTTARRLARLLQTLGTTVVGYDPTLHASSAHWAEWDIRPIGLQALFASCDAVSVQLDFFSRYRGLLGERVLADCLPGQVLVSLSPLALFDARALAAVLRSGRMTAAWMDQAGPEARSEGHPLHGVRGLVITPQLAAYTREARLRSAWGVARRLDRILSRAPAGDRVVTMPARAADLLLPPRGGNVGAGLSRGAAAATAASPASR
ncbi:MAG: hypothetical protein RLZZ592_2050 [Pseudomonadota bacterium]|jgi:D-3-phosphoglycerate dehydrogenase